MSEKRFPHWLLGLVLICGGGGMFILVGVPQGATAEERGMAFGMGLMQALAMIAGAVLIGVHFARAKKPK